MTKMQKLKVELIKYNRNKSIAAAYDICNWLYNELVTQPKKIEVKEG